MLCICFMFLNLSRQIFAMDRSERQADEYIAPGVVFFYVFCVFKFLPV
jgi:hypothetical protein